ncbi:MAG: hypothetical protein QNJ31_00520 [Candidatus Caenarcaniphilales bacterium]|nr:hypothetical protein [Candidatus Caenarcaniphilales bacterium]
MAQKVAPPVKRKIKDVIESESQNIYESSSSFTKQEEDWLSIQNFSEEEETKSKLIEYWFEDEGFEVEKDNSEDSIIQDQESYKFRAHKRNEKVQRDYLIEVKDNGKSIKKVNWLIL